jgi:uncharacterized protein (TIGR03118 family)
MSNPCSKHLWASVIATVAFMIAALPAQAQRFTRTDLTQNATGVSTAASHTDAHMVNPWGMSRSSGGDWWLSDNTSGLSTLYDSNGVPQSLVVTIPPPAGSKATAAPSGTVYNYTNSFNVTPGWPSFFIFVTEDGTISGWNPGVSSTQALLIVDRSKVAEYKGCALATTAYGPRFFASNFKSGEVEVFDGNFHLLTFPAGSFSDPLIPADYVPFNIQNVGGHLVITFAFRSPGSHDESHGSGLGYVDIFDVNGRLLHRLVHGTYFNAPWGVAETPADFGALSHRLLIGNFGDGTINIFDPSSGEWEGKMQNASGAEIVIPGLWGLSFGNGASAGSSTVLYYTAGPSDESQGLFGTLTPLSTEQRGNSE